MNDTDVLVIGGGIVGLAAAMAITERWPRRRIVILEKEASLGAHQTGHNSGVLHSGIYYQPGSLKATYCREGREALIRFCQDHGVVHEVCGKLIVATREAELAGLEALRQRGEQHGLRPVWLSEGEVKEREPNVTCVAGLFVPSTGIVDFPGVAATFAQRIRERDADVRLGEEVRAINEGGDTVTVETLSSTYRAKALVNCAGLHSDRIARIAGHDPQVQIVPFRGEYFELVPDRRTLVKGLVYPVPNPAFPFLGVHFTRMVDESVHVGPNAVPGLAREGYRKRDIETKDLVELLRFPGFWRLARRHARDGAGELVRSWSKTAFVRDVQRLVPSVGRHDIVPAGAGVRAQALRRDGRLIDDFLFLDAPRAVHVLNAPSPAATSCMPIGNAIAQRLAPMLDGEPIPRPTSFPGGS